MEEQRQRQEEEARRSGAVPEPVAAAAAATGAPASNEDAMLERALAMSMDQPASAPVAVSAAPSVMSYPDFATMSEEEQIAYAMQMSMQETRMFVLSIHTYLKFLVTKSSFHIFRS